MTKIDDLEKMAKQAEHPRALYESRACLVEIDVAIFQGAMTPYTALALIELVKIQHKVLLGSGDYETVDIKEIRRAALASFDKFNGGE